MPTTGEPDEHDEQPGPPTDTGDEYAGLPSITGADIAVPFVRACRRHMRP